MVSIAKCQHFSIETIKPQVALSARPSGLSRLNATDLI